VRILHILDHSIPLQSGYSFRTLAILEHQRRLGWQTFQLTSPKHYAAEASKETCAGYDFYRLAPVEGIGGRLPVVNQALVIRSLAARLGEVVAEVQPDVLHAHSPALNGIAALHTCRRFGLPLVYEVRAFWEDAAVNHGTSREGGLRYRLSRALESHVLHRADAVTTICHGLKQEIEARGIQAEKVTVVPNSIDPVKFSGESASDRALQERYGLAGKTVLGFIGSFYDYEGLDTLLAAMPAILSEDESVRLLLVGGGPQERSLKQQAEDLGLEDKVIFTGRVPHEEINRYYDLVDVLVYPRHSMRLTELVTPLKPLEAMARGRLVAVSNVGGHRELVSDADIGYLFRSGDVGSLEAVVRTILSERPLWQKKKESARRFVKSERSWSKSVALYQGVYESVLEHASRG